MHRRVKRGLTNLSIITIMMAGEIVRPKQSGLVLTPSIHWGYGCTPRAAYNSLFLGRDEMKIEGAIRHWFTGASQGIGHHAMCAKLSDQGASVAALLAINKTG